MVEEEFGEEVDGVVGLGLEGLAQSLREHKADLVLLEIGNVGMLLIRGGLLLLLL